MGRLIYKNCMLRCLWVVCFHKDMNFCIGSRQPTAGGWELHIFKEDVFRSVTLQASNLANSKPLRKAMATRASAWYDYTSRSCGRCLIWCCRMAEVNYTGVGWLALLIFQW